jgi:hypothetical protein
MPLDVEMATDCSPENSRSRDASHYAACYDLNGEPVCWWCGKYPPAIDRRWCSYSCSLCGERMLAQSPRPERIRRACRKIQRGWSPQEEAARRLNRRGEELTALLRLEIPMLPTQLYWADGHSTSHLAIG